jgi:hypothetical protein
MRYTIAKPLLCVRCPNEDCSEQIRNEEQNEVDDPQDVPHGRVFDVCPVVQHHLDLNGHRAYRLAVRPFEEDEVKQEDEERDSSRQSRASGSTGRLR